MLPRIVLLLLTISLLSIVSHAAPRSPKARRAFMKLYPCPSTGKTSGPCPEYRADHIIPLACGGADHWMNFQWLTVDDWKAKSKWERKGTCVRCDLASSK